MFKAELKYTFIAYYWVYSPTVDSLKVFGVVAADKELLF